MHPVSIMLLGAWLSAAELTSAAWALSALAVAAIVFGVIYFALIPRFARAQERRARRFVRPPDKSSWSGRDRAAA